MRSFEIKNSTNTLKNNLILNIFLLSFTTFADDALVLPKNVWRFYNVYSYTKADSAYDSDGNRTAMGTELGKNVKTARNGISANSLDPQIQPELTIDRYDLALEYGFTNKISTQIQIPMYMRANLLANPNIDMLTAVNQIKSLANLGNKGQIGELFTKLTENGKKTGTLGDLTFGAKYQYLNTGKNAIGNESQAMRGALALGLKLPTGSIQSPDTNDISTTTANDTKAWIVGGRTYFDYYPASWVYTNFYSEHEYRFSGDRKYLGSPTTTTYEVIDTKYQSGLYNLLELDTHFVPELVQKWTLDSGARFVSTFTARGKYTRYPEKYRSVIQSKENSVRTTHFIPYLGVFTTQCLIPIRLKISKTFIMEGKNASSLTESWLINLQLYAQF